MMGNAGTLTIKTACDGPICVLTLSGDLDFLAVTDFLVHAARFVDVRAERCTAPQRRLRAWSFSSSRCWWSG
jgi:hypothetical protein